MKRKGNGAGQRTVIKEIDLVIKEKGEKREEEGGQN